MQLITNSVAPTQVTDNGDHYLIRDVPFVTNMELSGGYVPERSIKETATAWQGVPATLNHPRNNAGKPVPARAKPETHIGEIVDSWYDGEYVRANLRLDKDRLQQAGATAIEDALETGEQIHVSSQYVPNELPAGEYDGQQRDNVEAIAKPDSVAILPNKRGKCDIQDGCGINPQLVANATVSMPMTPTPNAQHFEQGDLVEWPFGDGTGQGRVVEVFTEPGEVTRTIKGTEVTREVTEDEPAYLVTVWRGDDFAGQALKSGSELSEWTNPPEDAMQSNQRTNQSVDYALTDVTPDDVDSYTDDEWDGSAAVAAMPNPSEDDDAPEILDQTHLLIPGNEDARDDKANWKLPFRTGPDAPVNTRALVAARAAISGARGGIEGVSQADLDGAESRAVDFLVAAPDDLFGSMDDDEDDMSGASGHVESNSMFDLLANVAGRLFGRAGADIGTSTDAQGSETTGAESPADPQTINDTVNREQLITEITQNSKLTKAALAERCNDGLKAIHDDVMAATDDAGGADSPTPNDSNSDTNTNSDMTDDAITFNSEEEFEQYVEDIVANRVEQREAQREKQRLAEEIVANSADYEDTETVLADYPTEAALEAKRDSLRSGGAMPGSGVSANFEGPDDGLDIDVSSGVLTE